MISPERIAIYSVTTGELRELPPLKLAWAQGLSWAPDGRSLALTAVDLRGRAACSASTSTPAQCRADRLSNSSHVSGRALVA